MPYFALAMLELRRASYVAPNFFKKVRERSRMEETLLVSKCRYFSVGRDAF